MTATPRDVAKLRRKLGIVFQDFRLLEDRTVEQNVGFALEVIGAPPAVIGGKVARVLTQVGLAAKGRALPRELSGGEQQRVAIARALVNDPFALIADEPTGNLDDRATRGIFQLLREINAAGTAIIMATHNLELIRRNEFRTIEMARGQIVFDSAEPTAPGEADALMRATSRRARDDFQRSPLLSALSVTTIAFSLFALGLFGLVALNIREALEQLEDRVEIRAFVAEGTEPEDVVRAAIDIAAYPEVLSAQVVTQEQALKRAQAELGEFKDVYRGGRSQLAARIIDGKGDRGGDRRRGCCAARAARLAALSGSRPCWSATTRLARKTQPRNA